MRDSIESIWGVLGWRTGGVVAVIMVVMVVWRAKRPL